MTYSQLQLAKTATNRLHKKQDLVLIVVVSVRYLLEKSAATIQEEYVAALDDLDYHFVFDGVTD